VDGQIVDPITGSGIDGARVEIVRTGGLALDVDSVGVATSEGGHWRLELGPKGAGAVEVEIVVAAPGAAPYRVPTVLTTRDHRGDATLLPPWVPVPYFSFVGEFFLNGTVDRRVEGAPVEFRRTGGVLLRGPGIATGTYNTTTDAGGRFAAFPTQTNAVFPVTFGAVVGDFSVNLGPTLGTTVVRDVRLQATPVYKQPAAIFRYAVGPGTP
jgi:hypothetical protein